MTIRNEKEAVAILDDHARDPWTREGAGRYLEHHPTERLIPRLVIALQDNDEGVRRAAAEGLIRLGIKAWPDLLLALMEGKRGGDTRLRRGVYHVLHNGTVGAEVTAPLLYELHGISSTDISAMIEADRLYKRMATNPVFAARLAVILRERAATAAAPMEAKAMDIPVDAAVVCADGFGGHSCCVVINPVLRQVTHVVIEEKAYPFSTRLVPLDLVEGTTHKLIRLRCTRHELAAQKAFIETKYVAGAMPFLAYMWGEYALWPYVPAPEVPPMPLEHEQIPPDEMAIQHGTRVLATDGQVGRVDEFVVTPNTGIITHLVLREGHLWGQRDVTIPVAQIDHIEEDALYLKLDKHGVEMLPAVPAKRRVN